LRMKPGMAGLAWIRGRNAIPWEERFRYDVLYVRKWSMRLDCWIFLRAVVVVLRREGVYGKDGVARDVAPHSATREAER